MDKAKQLLAELLAELFAELFAELRDSKYVICYTISVQLGDLMKSDEHVHMWIKHEAATCPIVKYILGYIYMYNDFGMDSDSERVFKLIQESANTGYPEAQFRLGVMYRTGTCVQYNATKAFEWLLKSSISGHGAACFEIGSIYEQGELIPKDNIKAYEWYKKSADQGITIAQNMVGTMLAYGTGTPMNLDEAIRYFSMSINNGGNTTYFNYTVQNTGIVPALFKSWHELGLENLKLRAELNELKGELDELRISAPIEGGPEYRKALERFNSHKDMVCDRSESVSHEKSDQATGLD